MQTEEYIQLKSILKVSVILLGRNEISVKYKKWATVVEKKNYNNPIGYFIPIKFSQTGTEEQYITALWTNILSF